jgi:hypothetical protein
MSTIDSSQLATVCGGQVITRRATRAQLDEANRCMERAGEKSRWKPWTWGRPTAGQCFGRLIKQIRTNPPEQT